MKKIWIIGKRGLLGSSFSHLPFCISSDRYEADITQLESLKNFSRKQGQITHIVNASAFTQVDLSEVRKEEAYLVNAVGAENVAKIACLLKAKYIHISTDYVFPGTSQYPLKEEDITAPVNYYGYTKREGEKRVLEIQPHACIIRTSALFGMQGKSFASKLFALLQEKEHLFLANDQINSPTLVSDLTKTILEMLDQSGIYHFSNQGTASKYSFTKKMKEFMELSGFSVKTKKLQEVKSCFFKECCPRPMYTEFDITKIRQCLSFPIRNWEEALAEFIQKKAYAIASKT